jgi:SAM-dependent methyltransferase
MAGMAGATTGADGVVLQCAGHCPICEGQRTFTARQPWLRDHLLCSGCGSIPRERAVMACIQEFVPEWRSKRIHESSPGGRGASIKLHAEAKRYEGSQFYPKLPLGSTTPSGWRNEDLERLGLPDASVDLFVTQDVLEHVFDADAVFREIARVLAPGGMHIASVPLVNKAKPTEQAALRRADGSVEHLRTPEYHGNPVDDAGSLVTWRWGYDIASRVLTTSGLHPLLVRIDDLSRGIRAEYIEILVAIKPS